MLRPVKILFVWQHECIYTFQCPLACVPKYTRKTLIPKLIKRETSPENEIKPNSKVHNYFYFYSFLLSKPTRAERWIWVDFHSFPKKSDISSDFISNPLRPWMPENQITRETSSQLWYSPEESRHKSVLRGAWDCLECTPDILVIALEHHKS